jgi:tetratricopeptide (TPR) repeat protein
MYSVREVSAVLGITVARLRTYLRSGLMTPTRDEKGKIRFTFQDLLLLRKAEGLVAQRIAPRRVHSALRALAERMTDRVNAAGLRLLSEGNDVVVEEGTKRWNARSGQTLFHFQPQPEEDQGTNVIPLMKAKARGYGEPPVPTLSVNETYERACALETLAPEEAITAYRIVLEREPEFADAHVNLGRLLHESGDVYAALVHYRAALSIRPSDSTAAFNAGVALEDLGANADAIAAYRQAIGIDPRNADAHYNLARILEQSGKPDLAVQHLLLYRQLMKKR